VAPSAGYHVPAGYEASSPPPAPAPTPVEPVDPNRARKQALRDQMRLTVGVGLAYTGTIVDLNGDGLTDLNEGWAIAASIGGRYHFARFGSFQARAEILGGRYVGDRDYAILVEGGQVALLAQATLRFVAYPFYLGGGAALGFVTIFDYGTQLSAGGLGEIGVIFGRDEHLDVGIQVLVTSSMSGFVGTFAWSFGEA